MSTAAKLNLRDAVRALEALPDEQQEAAMRDILSRCPDGTFASAIDADQDDGDSSPRTRPPLLRLLDEARPYAERLVYREGILSDHAAEGVDCIDGAREVIGDWHDRQLDEEHRKLIEMLDGNLYTAAMAVGEIDYILGIAVGVLLRLPQSESAASVPVNVPEQQTAITTIGDRLKRITAALGLIHATAAALSADVKTELHDDELIEAIADQSGQCLSELWWIETADKGLLDKPAPTADEHEALAREAR